jgi:hypothetical protein
MKVFTRYAKKTAHALRTALETLQTDVRIALTHYAPVEDMGVDTGIDLEALIETAGAAERIVGRELPSQVLRAGPRTRLTPFTGS